MQTNIDVESISTRSNHRRNNLQMATSNYTSTDIQRFWKKVNKDGSIPAHMPHLGKCWEWTASTKPFGYGQFNLKTKTLNAHKISWELINGDTNGLHVLHKCDNPRCVNPLHLFLGTDADNKKDMVSKGRQASIDKTVHRGESNGYHKLTAGQVRDIRSRNVSGFGRKAQLAREFGISQSTLGRIISGKAWSHID